jgi:hypothetical protein
MKSTLMIILALLVLASTGCNGSLEQIVESRRQARLDAANRQLNEGAGDGVGLSMAESSQEVAAQNHSAAGGHLQN